VYEPPFTTTLDSNADSSSNQWQATTIGGAQVALARSGATWDTPGLKGRRSEQSGTVDPPVTRLGAMAIPIQVVFDRADPPVVARFWADVLGDQLQGPLAPTTAWQAWQVEHGIRRKTGMMRARSSILTAKVCASTSSACLS
jgi:hypothetical protein